MTRSPRHLAILLAAQLALAAPVAACASLVGVQDGTLDVDSGQQDGTTEAAPGEAGIDATSDTTTDTATSPEGAPDSSVAQDSGPAEDTGTVEDSGSGQDSATVDAPEDTATPEEAGPDASTDAGLDGAADAASDANSCATQVPDTTNGVFVAPTGIDATHCGVSPSAPCLTVQAGLDSASSQGRTIVYVAAGTYTESISLYPHVTLQGGWNDSGGVWTPICPGPDAGTASGAVTIQAPSTSDVTVSATSLGGTATLSTLTVASIPQSQVAPGQSLYGIIATGSNTTLALDDVVAQIASGGPGGGGAAGTMPAGATGTCTPGTGVVGGPGSPGTGSDGGAFSSGGYAAGAGGPGTTGSPGSNGVTGGMGVCATCVTAACISGSCGAATSAKTCGSSGLSGCGGAGGGLGTGGGGGGSSIVLYVWDAQVSVSGTTLTAGAGGNGGNGGAGADGGTGSAGAKGVPAGSCDTTLSGNCILGCNAGTPVFLDAGTTGGAGAAGGAGGQGGGGAGGWSCAYYVGGAATVDTSFGGNTFTPGMLGSGGVPGGADGTAKDRCP